MAVSEATVAVLAFVAILMGSRDTRRAREDAETAERQRALERHSEYEAGIILQVAEAYEQWVMGHGGDELGMTDEGPLIRPRAEARIRALLSALPITTLPLVRWQIGREQDTSAEALFVNLRGDEGRFAAEVRTQIAVQLRTLTAPSVANPSGRRTGNGRKTRGTNDEGPAT